MCEVVDLKSSVLFVFRTTYGSSSRITGSSHSICTLWGLCGLYCH